MDAKQACDAMLDSIGLADRESVSRRSKSRVGKAEAAALPSTSRGCRLTIPLPVEAATSATDRAGPALMPESAMASSSIRSDGGAIRGSAAARTTVTDTESVTQLRTTVQTLVDQMAWFMDQMTYSGDTESDYADDAPAQGPAPATAPDIEEGEIVEALNNLEHSFAGAAELAPDIDVQLASIINNILKTRLSDEKARVDGEICEASKLSEFSAHTGQLRDLGKVFPS